MHEACVQNDKTKMSRNPSQGRNHRGRTGAGKATEPTDRVERARVEAETVPAGVLVERELAAFGLDGSAALRDGLVAYCRLLLLWNERINLTAARSVAALVADHLPDSLAIAVRLSNRTDVDQIVDVGSGGGFPAIPLALVRPSGHYTLVEATGKKVAFLRAAARELGIDGRVEVQHRRVEPGERPGRFDAATSRALAAPPVWLAMGQGLVRRGGSVFCLSSHRVDAGIPAGLELVQQAAYRAHRWVVELKRST
jgi:16S rRNA (guanine527-N7)-methyltransferase